MVYLLGMLAIKTYGRFKLGEKTRFVLTTFEKIALWISLALFFSYII